MPSIKEFNLKLHSLRNTEKMTRTMKLVSMSKLYKAQEDQRKAKLYAQHLTDLLRRLAASVESADHPLFQTKGKQNNALVVLFTSDRGLCGAFNNSLIRHLNRWIDENAGRYDRIDLSFCGKRGYMSFRKGQRVRHFYEGVTAVPQFDNAKKIGEDLTADFVAGQYREIFVAHNEYHSPLSQSILLDKILPIAPKPLVEGGTKLKADYVFEPKQDELLGFLIPRYLYFRIYFTLLENSAGEHGARMTTMDSATKNAKKMIDLFTLRRNRARQAAITTELIEIISGAEALK